MTRKEVQSRWTRAKLAILRAGRSLKNKAVKYRYHMAYALVMVVIALAAIQSQRKVTKLTTKLRLTESMVVHMGEKGIPMNRNDLRIAMGEALSNEHITAKLEEYARHPEKGLPIAAVAKDICKWGPDVCYKDLP